MKSFFSLCAYATALLTLLSTTSCSKQDAVEPSTPVAAQASTDQITGISGLSIGDRLRNGSRKAVVSYTAGRGAPSTVQVTVEKNGRVDYVEFMRAIQGQNQQFTVDVQRGNTIRATLKAGNQTMRSLVQTIR